MTNIINTIKNGDKVEINDGYTRKIAKVYGIKNGKFGRSVTLKINNSDGSVEFYSTSAIHPNTENYSKPIGCYKA